EPEPVRAHDVLLVRDRGAEPGAIGVLVLTPRFPLARVRVEHRLVHHRGAVLHRTDGLAHAAAATRLHIGVVEAVRHHIEARVRALDPAERAFHARLEVDHWPHRPRGELLEIRIALGYVALPALLGLADGDGRNRDALAHLPPLRHLERVRDLG